MPDPAIPSDEERAIRRRLDRNLMLGTDDAREVFRLLDRERAALADAREALVNAEGLCGTLETHLQGSAREIAKAGADGCRRALAKLSAQEGRA